MTYLEVMVFSSKWFTDLFKSKARKKREELQRQWTKWFEGVTEIEHLTKFHLAVALLQNQPYFFKPILDFDGSIMWVTSIYENPRISFTFKGDIYMENRAWGFVKDEKEKERVFEAIKSFSKYMTNGKA